MDLILSPGAMKFAFLASLSFTAVISTLYTRADTVGSLFGKLAVVFANTFFFLINLGIFLVIILK